MTTHLSRFRGPIIGLVAVLFSAGIVLAAQPASPGATGLAIASQHAGKTVPVKAAGDESGSQDESSESPDSDTGGTTGPSGSGNSCTIDLTDPAAVAAAPNHGAIVCSAAQTTTLPTGYANHGAWVSHWAKMNHGSDASANGTSHKPSTPSGH